MPPNSAQSALDLLVLTVLRRRGPLHGYGIATNIGELSDGDLQVEEGSLYPALHRMEENGWLTSFWGESENRRRAKYYRLTKAGTRQLGAETAEWQKIALAMTHALKTS